MSRFPIEQITAGDVAADETTPLCVFGASRGVFRTPAAIAGVVTVHSCDSAKGEYAPLISAGNAVTFTVTPGKDFILPDAIFNCRFVKFAFPSTFIATVSLR
ncbi:hypothetical protein [Anatilimnocola floriformis]|uniref:hypothetical protein n=1 Tax=Anatilimnocola floriformis TaxID=2948575 RepID=UPI0020C45222|nr:hypothetical protein [Anatilimnocola floriformis]